MSILLDTHVFLWAALNDRRLSSATRDILDRSQETVFLSAVSALEISVKWSKGRLKLPVPPFEFIDKSLSTAGISQLAVTARDACGVGDLPFHHNDPFDRLLVAQAKANGLQLMTADPILERYDVDVIGLWMDDDDE